MATVKEYYQSQPRGMKILFALVGIGLLTILVRLATGLGATTNLSDDVPWGLWIAVDVLCGVALAAGGFSVAAAVYIFNMKKYRPIVRPAVLTAFIGYLVVVFGLFVDIGKPFSFWHPLVMWNYHSIMFEIVWCITLYTAVLALEFAPAFLERFKWEKTLNVLKKFIYPLVIAGIVLSYLHQSSLGALFLIVPQKLNHLWYSPIIPQLFFLSAIALGLAMVSLESIMGSRVFKREYEMGILQGLTKGVAIVLAIYLVVKIADLAVRGSLPLVFTSGAASFFFITEMLVGVLIPLALFARKQTRESVNGILTASSFVIVGIVMNRFNANFFTQAGTGTFYFPAILEFLVTIGLISLAILLYRLAVTYLPVFPEAERT
ncbi:MAG TPA: Ni/Fe-hydrogenase cytochrome b subunit [Nitrospiraceae bacterium]|nr:Ni/Fe-hydrogenase cytochrome b subunit [Nitrospiraceae bacterium]